MLQLRWYAWAAPSGVVHVVERVHGGGVIPYCEWSAFIEVLRPTPDAVMPIGYMALTCMTCAAWWRP